jgi:uncharacterized protein
MTGLVRPTVTLSPLPEGMKHRFHAMVKPVGSMCNLDCKYCYYLHKEELLHQLRQPRMSDEMLEQHIRQYIEAQTGDQVVFSWQGGEPTILGLEFFRKVVALQAQYKNPASASKMISRQTARCSMLSGPPSSSSTGSSSG